MASLLHPLMSPDLLIRLHLASEAEFCVADALTGGRGGTSSASLHIFKYTHTRIHTHVYRHTHTEVEYCAAGHFTLNWHHFSASTFLFTVHSYCKFHTFENHDVLMVKRFHLCVCF